MSPCDLLGFFLGFIAPLPGGGEVGVFFFLEENHLCLEHYFALPPVVERASSLKYLAFLRINANASDEKKVSVAGGKGVGKCSNLIGQRRNLRYIVGVNCSLTLVFRFSVNLQPPSFVFFKRRG